jgi:hypothetical protein
MSAPASGPVSWQGVERPQAGTAPDAAPVSWGTVRYKSRWWKRDANLKIVIAILIGVVSVAGAVLTWRAALLEERATDRDRQAVAETVLQQQNLVNVDTQLRNEQEAFAEYREHLINADQLDAEAAALEARDPSAAQIMRDEAVSLRELADRLASFTFNLAYVTTDEESGELVFALDERRRDLVQLNEAAVRANPEQVSAEAVSLRNRSQRLVGWIIVLIATIVVLTVAQISRNARIRPYLVGGAMAVFVVAMTVAVVGD